MKLVKDSGLNLYKGSFYKTYLHLLPKAPKLLYNNLDKLCVFACMHACVCIRVTCKGYVLQLKYNILTNKVLFISAVFILLFSDLHNKDLDFIKYQKIYSSM